MTNERKLMPYEHQLIEALDITKEDYLDFVAQQHAYEDIKEGTILDIRNDPGTIGLVLTIVGTILQVVSALLAKPETGRRQSRDDVFAPRSGFNSTQQLAAYGDPVNLIYANTTTNPQGGARVNTALIWSAIKSFGSSQYVQMLLLIGGGGIGRIDYRRSAFGQTPVRDIVSQNYWLYFQGDGTGPIVKRHLLNDNASAKDPGAPGSNSSNIYRVSQAGNINDTADGFSNAISPSTSNRFGVYAPVPINVKVKTRFESGNITRAEIGIYASLLNNWGGGALKKANGLIAKGEKLRITLKETKKQYDRIAEEEAAEFRRSVSAAFDNAGVMKLGSALFAVASIDPGSTEERDMTVNLVCTRAGLAPSIPYEIDDPIEDAQALSDADPVYQSVKSTSEALLNEDQRNAGFFVQYDVVTTPQDLLNDGRIFVRRKVALTDNELSSLLKAASTSDRSLAKYFEFKRNLTKAEKQTLKAYIAYQKQIANGTQADDLFFIKALVKIEIAKYETLSPSHSVDFAIKGRVWRRIGGRQEKYGTKEREGYKSSDNGLKRRSSMFTVKYKKLTETEFTYVKGIFVVARSADIDNFVYFRFDSGGNNATAPLHWQFEIEPVHDSMAEFRSNNLTDENGRFRFFYLENAGPGQRISASSAGDPTSIIFTGKVRISNNQLPPLNKSPRLTNEWDLFSDTSDTQLQTSFDQGPEFIVTAVTEQLRFRFTRLPGLYKDLSLLGFNMYSGRNVQDLRAVSVFVEQGRRSRLLRSPSDGAVNGIAWGQPNYEYLSPSPNGYANRAPDIFVDTILDNNDGIGKYAGMNESAQNLFSIDLEQLARSKEFCRRNGLFMDGVIAEPTSWRQFWSENAGFSLLELAKQDGKESLIPALPYNKTSGRITTQIDISALFTPGNILEDSYKEEFVDYGNTSEDIIATVIYRENSGDGAFAKNNSVDVMLRDADEDSTFKETIDASAFVTRREQAILIGKFLCQTRRHSRRAIEFKTFPTDSFVAPGSYIYVEFAQNQWNRIQTGIIGEGGKLNLPFGEIVNNGSYQMLIYNPALITNKTLYREAEPIVDGASVALRKFKDYVFVLGQVRKNKRVFRVTEVSMDEEGEVTIKGVEHGTDADGLSLISRGLGEFVSGLFRIDGDPE